MIRNRLIFRRSFLVSLVLPAFLVLPGSRVAAGPPRETWYGVFLTGKRAGYLAREEARETWQNQPADRTKMRMRLDLRVLGTPATTLKEQTTWATPQGVPLEETLVTYEKEEIALKVRARYGKRSVTFDAEGKNGSARRQGTLTLNPGERFWSGDSLLGEPTTAALPPDTTRFRYKSFDAETLTLRDAELSVGRRRKPSPDSEAEQRARREVVAVGGSPVTAYRRAFTWGGTAGTAWEDANGDLLRVDVGPLRLVRLSKAVASAPLTERLELTEVASFAPDRPITDPRALTRARYRIENLTAPLDTPDDDVQQITGREKRGENSYEALVSVTNGPVDSVPFVAMNDLAVAYRKAGIGDNWVKASVFVPSDRPEMIALAKKITGEATGAGQAAAALSAWVHKSMTYDVGAVFSGPRDAAQILQSKKGVCQDYATLLVTLARAAGIPAKHCIGLAYADGRFYGHAWAEVWIGKWVALEPTWGTPFADATHIKLAEGEPTADRPGASRLDAYKITFLDPK